MTKFKNSNCDKTQKLKWSQNLKTQTVTKLKNQKCKNSSCDKTQIVKNLNCDKTQVVTKPELWQNSNFDLKKIKFDNSDCDSLTEVTEKTFFTTKPKKEKKK